MILGFDIGGSRIKAGLAVAGALQDLGDCATPLTDFADFCAALSGYLRPGLRGVAISVAGVVDQAGGRIKVANIPCLDGRTLAGDLQAVLGLPVLVLNDADCFALAEAQAGAGRGARTVFGIILGTGVGGGVVIDGQVLTGTEGYAGEWGHGPVIAEPAFPCGCGQIGCVDTIGGARGLERLHHHLTGAHRPSQEILQRWHGGEAETVALWLRLLAGPLAMAVNLLGAGAVPVGGGLSNDRALIAALDEAVRACILRRTEAPLVVPAQVSADAGLLGAVAAGEAAFA